MNQKKKRKKGNKAWLKTPYNAKKKPALKKKMRKAGFMTLAKGTRHAVEATFEILIK